MDTLNSIHWPFPASLRQTILKIDIHIYSLQNDLFQFFTVWFQDSQLHNHFGYWVLKKNKQTWIPESNFHSFIHKILVTFYNKSRTVLDASNKAVGKIRALMVITLLWWKQTMKKLINKMHVKW